MSKEDKKPQYFVPVSVYKSSKTDHMIEALMKDKRNGNLSNMKSQLQANQSTDKSKRSIQSFSCEKTRTRRYREAREQRRSVEAQEAHRRREGFRCTE